MTDAVADGPQTPAKSGKGPMIVGLVLALAGGGGGFYGVTSGLIPLGKPPTESHAEEPVTDLPDIAYVEMDPIMISLSSNTGVQHLRFRAQLEVEAPYRGDVETILPRVIDVLNGYLRALEITDLRDPLALIRLRSQMLRRIQIVAGKGRVRDLLIMEFVLN